MLPSQQGRSSFFDDSAKTPPKRRPGSKARDGASPLIWGWLYPSLTRLFTWGWLSLTRVAQWSWLTLTRVTQWVRGNPKRRGALLLAAAGLLSLLLFWTPHIGHSNASAAAQLKGGQAASSQRTEQVRIIEFNSCVHGYASVHYCKLQYMTVQYSTIECSTLCCSTVALALSPFSTS